MRETLTIGLKPTLRSGKRGHGCMFLVITSEILLVSLCLTDLSDTSLYTFRSPESADLCHQNLRRSRFAIPVGCWRNIAIALINQQSKRDIA